jgi:DNA-binding transcriptional LysR family regulator
MEFRHLRYFIAVAEEGSFSNAAERRLHTAQPSLSRQIRDLELEVGVKLLERKARGSAYLYRVRNLVERFFNKIKQCRRVATRYDKLAANHLAFV